MVAPRHKPFRVFIADGCSIIRNGLITTIESEPQMEVVGTVPHRHEIVPCLSSASADVLVINITGLGDTPVALMHEIQQAYPRLGVVVVASAVDFAPELLAAGVQGYVSFAEPDEQLHLAIRAAKLGHRFLSPLVQDYVDRCGILTTQHRFVPREVQIIKYMAQGLDTDEIAQHLGINFQTVRNYVCRIRKKTGWTTWPQMVSWYHSMYGGDGRTAASFQASG